MRTVVFAETFKVRLRTVVFTVVYVQNMCISAHIANYLPQQLRTVVFAETFKVVCVCVRMCVCV